MTRKRHPNKEIESAIQFAEENDWTIKSAGKSAHAFAILRCPHNDLMCRCGRFCQASIWRTCQKDPESSRELYSPTKQDNENQVEQDD